LLVFFFAYIYWLLSKKEHFKLIYSQHPIKQSPYSISKDILKITLGSAILLFVAQIIVNLAHNFSADTGISLALVGILLVGLGNSFPETYFSIIAARNDKTKMILGDIMGAVILPGTLVLGLVALASPFSITNTSMFMAARYFLLIAAILFFYLR